MAAGERDIINFARRRRGDAVRPASFRILEDVHLAGPGIDPAVNAVLPGEPVDTVAVERAGIEVSVASPLRQLPDVDLLGLRIVADDGILAAVRDPGRAVRALDDAVGRRKTGRAAGGERGGRYV